MYLNNVSIGLLLIALTFTLVIPQSLKAETTLVFLDNSGSIDYLQEVYLHDIETIMEVAGPNPIYFAPIGNYSSSGISCEQILSSNLSRSGRRAAIQNQFRFNNWYTKIYDSLSRLESCNAFKEADKILIISDMESDFQRTAGRWYFDRQDLDDVQNTQTLLQHWIEQGKEINLVLHGWNKVPKRDGDFIRYQDSFGTLWQTQFEQASDGKLVKQRRENKKLVALGLLELREQHPQAVHLFEMPLEMNGYRNEEAFLYVLCGTLPITRQEAAQVCVTRTKTKFNIAIDVAPQLVLSSRHRKHLYNQSQGGEIRDSQFIGPRRYFEIQSLRKGLSKHHPTSAEFHFKILRSRGGQPYWYPRMETFVKDLAGKWLPLKVITANKRQPSRQQAARWAADNINQILNAFVKGLYPVLEPSKKIFLFNQDGSKLVGNYEFSAYYRFSDGKNEEEAKWTDTVENGVIQLPLPKEVHSAKLYLKGPRFQDGRYEMGDLPVNLINSPQSIKFMIPDDRKVNVPIQLQFADVQPQATAIEFFHKGTTMHKTSVAQLTYKGSQSQLSLLPGRYYWEVIPVEEEILGTVGDKRVELPRPTKPVQKLKIELKKDPLTEQSQWNSEMASLLNPDPEANVLTEKGGDLIEGSAHFFRALFHYTSSQLDNMTELKQLWREVRTHINKLSLDRHRLLKRSMLGIYLGDGTGNLIKEASDNLEMMFDIFITGTCAVCNSYSSSQAIDARRRYRVWIRNLLRDRDRILSPELYNRLQPRS